MTETEIKSLIEKSLTEEIFENEEDGDTLEKCFYNFFRSMEQYGCNSHCTDQTCIYFLMPCEQVDFNSFGGHFITKEGDLYFIEGDVFNPEEKPEKLVDLRYVSEPWIKKGK